MTTGMYDQNRTTTMKPKYEERRLLITERFYPGEFGWVIVLGIASLLVYSVAIYGVTRDTSPNLLTINTFQGYGPTNSGGLTTNPSGSGANGTAATTSPDGGSNGAAY